MRIKLTQLRNNNPLLLQSCLHTINAEKAEQKNVEKFFNLQTSLFVKYAYELIDYNFLTGRLTDSGQRGQVFRA